MIRNGIILLIALLGLAFSGCQTITREMVQAHLEVVTPEGDGPFPVVIYYQGTGRGGSMRVAHKWAQWFKSLGVASAIVDNAWMRGRTENPSGSMYTEDAALAWDILTANPKIDTRRFALMGFSRGGQQTLEAGPHFSGKRAVPGFIFALYPGGWGPDKCYSTHGKPTEVHIFFGDRDDVDIYEGVGRACRALAEVDKSVKFHELKGATHAYDDDFSSIFTCCRGRPVSVEPNPEAVEQTKAIIEKAMRARWNP